MGAEVLEVIGVEHAAGGSEKETPSTQEDGEGGHCGLCGLTSDRSAWESLSDELGVPVNLLSSDELGPEAIQVVREIGTPCVLVRFDDDELHPAVLAERLEVLDGDITRLVREVRLVADQQGWVLPEASAQEPEPETV